MLKGKQKTTQMNHIGDSNIHFETQWIKQLRLKI